MLERRRARQLIEAPVPAIGAYGYLKNLVTLAGGGLVVHGGAIIHRHGPRLLAAGPRGDLVEGADGARVPIYLTIHGKGMGEPGAGRWLDAKTFVFNESWSRTRRAPPDRVRAERARDRDDHHALAGWVETTNDGNWGTSHADMFLMVPDHHVAVLAPQLVNYGFVRYLMRNDWTVIEVPPEEYWDLACNAVTLRPARS